MIKNVPLLDTTVDFCTVNTLRDIVLSNVDIHFYYSPEDGWLSKVCVTLCWHTCTIKVSVNQST